MSYGLVLAALADPTRRKVFETLRFGALPVRQIAASLPVSRPAVSQHLRVLREAGLVRERRFGRQNFYDVVPGGLDALRRYLEDSWGQVLGDFKTAMEREEGAE